MLRCFTQRMSAPMKVFCAERLVIEPCFSFICCGLIFVFILFCQVFGAKCSCYGLVIVSTLMKKVKDPCLKKTKTKKKVF